MATSTRENRERYKGHVLNLMRHFGMLDGAIEPLVEPAIVDQVDVTTSVGGILEVKVGLGDDVAAGALLGTVADFRGEVLQELRAPRDAKVMTARTMVTAFPGDTVFRLLVHVPAPPALARS